MGYFRGSLGFGRGFSSKGVSVDEGNVEEELYLAEAEELSVWPLLEFELLVPPLTLTTNRLSSTGRPSLRGRPWLIRFKGFPPSKDLLPGLSKTRNDGS